MLVLKKIIFLNPVLNKKVAFLFSFLFLANSLYYAYHAIFTPFIAQIINGRLVYLILTALFIFLSLAGDRERKVHWKKILEIFILTLLPSAILMALGYFSYPARFKNPARAFANLIIVAASFIFFLKLFRSGKMSDFFSGIKNNPLSPADKKNNFFIIAVLSMVVLSNLAFGSYHLAKFAAVDEPLWTFDRIPKFWNNVLDGEWQKTMVSDKPGITVAALSGIGLTRVDPKEYDLVKKEGEVRFSLKNIETMNFPLRFPILFFNALMLIVFYYFLAKLFDKGSALLAVIFIGLSPILLGISRIINPDSVFWVFSTLSLLSYFLFLKNPEKKYLFFAAVFLGFSLLTKYIANFFFVFYFAMIFLNFILNEKVRLSWPAYFKKSILDYFIIIYLSLLTFFIFLPAAWVDLGRVAEATIFSEAFLKFWQLFLLVVLAVLGEIYLLKGKLSIFVLNYLAEKRTALIKIISFLFLSAIILSAANVLSGLSWINFEAILASPKSSLINPANIMGAFLANFYPLIFGIHPLAFLLMLAALWGLFFRKLSGENDVWIAFLALFIFFYYVACFFNNLGATVRYQIIIYPLAFILSSLGLNLLLKNLKEKTKFIFFGITAVFLLFSLHSIKPFYFSYASEFLPKNYVLNLKDMGDGSYEAAAYLNGLPNAQNLIIWTDKRGVCYFFQGGCMDTFELNKGIQIDYFVVSASRQSRTIRHIPYKGRHNDFEIEVDKIYALDNYDYRLDIGGRPNNFIKIFSYEKLIGKKD